MSCQNALGETLDGVRQLLAELPVPHLPGTFQVHLTADLNVRGPWPATLQDRAIDVIVTHLRRRLDEMLFIDPQRQLKARLDELLVRYDRMQHQRTALLASSSSSNRVLSGLTAQLDVVLHKVLAARIDFQVEEQGQQHLDKMRAELAGERAAIDAKLEGQHVRLRAMEQAAVLEQLPTSVIATRRARARLEALTAELGSLEERVAKADVAHEQATNAGIEAERLQMDLTVDQSLLLEIKGKPARIQPVRYEVLRQR